MSELSKLLKDIRACRLCEAHLPLGPKPIVRAAASARILIIGQAPGTKVHQTGIPWNDASGIRLRSWLEMDRETFYDEHHVAIVPMGLCYPGRGKSGDLPPRPECAATWHSRIWPLLPNIQLTLLIGHYAQRHMLGERRRKTLTDTVANFRDYGPEYFPLPHPSPRNQLWLKKNPWFDNDVLPELRKRMRQALDH
ncbi:MAG: uracil-DNA glycosylase family protein [Xanthomonadales bacterium]|nr:uracil-DNA glycosylase family protein [Xanthomonadales bacterium]